jgi:hypothetical protein
MSVRVIGTPLVDPALVGFETSWACI